MSMSEPVRLQDRVVIVTGAGGGLGHACLRGMFAARGMVVVNDLGGSTHGEGASASAADRVVEEIRAAVGITIANHDSVSQGARIVEQALDSFGRVDVVVNNAGIYLRDKTFHKMDGNDWEQVYQVHAEGAFKVTRAPGTPARAELGAGDLHRYLWHLREFRPSQLRHGQAELVRADPHPGDRRAQARHLRSTCAPPVARA